MGTRASCIKCFATQRGCYRTSDDSYCCYTLHPQLALLLGDPAHRQCPVDDVWPFDHELILLVPLDVAPATQSGDHRALASRAREADLLGAPQLLHSDSRDLPVSHDLGNKLSDVCVGLRLEVLLFEVATDATRLVDMPCGQSVWCSDESGDETYRSSAILTDEGARPRRRPA